MLFHTSFTLFTYIYVGHEEKKEKEEFGKGVKEASTFLGNIKRKLAHFRPNGSGKTLLIDRLLGKPMKEFPSSTGL